MDESLQSSKEILKQWENKFVLENKRKPSKDDLNHAPDNIRQAYKLYWKNKADSKHFDSDTNLVQKETNEYAKQINSKAWIQISKNKAKKENKFQTATRSLTVAEDWSCKLQANLSGFSINQNKRRYGDWDTDIKSATSSESQSPRAPPGVESKINKLTNVVSASHNDGSNVNNLLASDKDGYSVNTLLSDSNLFNKDMSNNVSSRMCHSNTNGSETYFAQIKNTPTDQTYGESTIKYYGKKLPKESSETNSVLSCSSITTSLETKNNILRNITADPVYGKATQKCGTKNKKNISDLGEVESQSVKGGALVVQDTLDNDLNKPTVLSAIKPIKIVSSSNLSKIKNCSLSLDKQNRSIVSNFKTGHSILNVSSGISNEVSVECDRSSLTSNETIAEGELSCVRSSLEVDNEIEEFRNLDDSILDLADTALYKVKSRPAPTKINSREERFQKKVADGTANQNYVKINLKKKIFVRGKRSMKGSKLKRQIWKQKMRRMKCHQCNMIGHIESECTNFGGESLLPKEMDYENDETCDSLEINPNNLEVDNPPSLKQKGARAKKREKRKADNEIESAKSTRKKRKVSEEVRGSTLAEFSGDSNDGIENPLVDQSVQTSQPISKARKEWSSKVEPLFDWEIFKNSPNIPDEISKGLAEFGHSSFRPGQKEAVMRILCGQSTLLTLSTGAGKSLCYQLPAMLYWKQQPALTLVVSPLVSLMEDQLLGLPKCIKAVCLHSGQSEKQKGKVTELLKSGEVAVLLVSPEAIVSGSMAMLWHEIPPISFACIDEAHCISQWSHNFRPSYLRVCKMLRNRMGVKTILGLTATATKPTLSGVCESLGVPPESVIRGQVLPDNLLLTVSRDSDKDNALITLLQGPRFEGCDSIIIYCTRQQTCENLACFLRSQFKDSLLDLESNSKKKKTRGISWSCEAYHAGLSSSRRRTIQDSFMKGKLKIVVATVAFGMGINKSDIRAVIHYNMPRNPESYVQEIGRSGRDGKLAHCHLFLDSNSSDLNELRRFTYTNAVDAIALKTLVNEAFPSCKCNHSLGAISCRRHEVALPIAELVNKMDVTEETIATLLCHLATRFPDWISFESQGYSTCNIKCYKGPSQLLELSKKCPILTIALVWEKQKAKKQSQPSSSVTFPIVRAASSVGWLSSFAKKTLKQLEWEKVNGQSRRSGILVQMSDLAFIVHSKGDLSSEDKEEVMNFLLNRTKARENAELAQLTLLYKALRECSEPSFRGCYSNGDEAKSQKLKEFIRSYFESDTMFEGLDNSEDNCLPDVHKNSIRNDIRHLVAAYPDADFTPRAVARIFHGIGSPCFPADIYGRRQNRFWRSCLDVPFNALLNLATEEMKLL